MPPERSWKRYTKKEEDLLRSLDKIGRVDEVAESMNRSIAALWMKTKKMGVYLLPPKRKSKTFIEKKNVSLDDLKEWEKGYVAGFLDADGNISLYQRSNTTLYRAVCINNTNRAVINWLHDKTGGVVYEIKRKRNNQRTCYRLCYSYSEQKKLLEMIIPFLVVKKERAEILLMFLDGEIDTQRVFEFLRNEKPLRGT